jgi:hypothetical protein
LYSTPRQCRTSKVKSMCGTYFSMRT